MELTQAQIEELQIQAAKAAQLEKEVETLKKNASEQNSYITKLEQSKQKAQEEDPKKGAPASLQLDPKLDRIFQHAERSFLRELTKEAEAALILQVGQAVYDAVKTDFEDFLNKNLKTSNAELSYVLSAFDLVLGRAIKNKEHAVHKAFSVDPTKQTQPINNQRTPNQKVSTMTPDDRVAGQLGNPNPNTQGETPRNTREAWKNFAARVK